MCVQHMSALQAYEVQVSSLMRATSRLEEELQSARAEKASVLADLASVRELCVKLDSSKELTTRQLAAKSMELERVSSTQCICIPMVISKPSHLIIPPGAL